MEKTSSQWYRVYYCIKPVFISPRWPHGMWSSWGKKYKSLRRAEQALNAVQNSSLPGKYYISGILPCSKPCSQQERVKAGLPGYDSIDAQTLAAQCLAFADAPKYGVI